MNVCSRLPKLRINLSNLNFVSVLRRQQLERLKFTSLEHFQRRPQRRHCDVLTSKFSAHAQVLLLICRCRRDSLASLDVKVKSRQVGRLVAANFARPLQLLAV